MLLNVGKTVATASAVNYQVYKTAGTQVTFFGIAVLVTCIASPQLHGEGPAGKTEAGSSSKFTDVCAWPSLMR